MTKKGWEGNPGDHEVKEEEPLEMPIDGILDLHTFRPSEVKDLIEDYIEACQIRGIREIRVIHGKGSGQLRRTVHSTLGRLGQVLSFSLCGGEAGGWGATTVTLRPGPTEDRTGKHKGEGDKRDE